MTDAELKILSVSCPTTLTNLNIKKCCQVSDCGILAVLESCHALRSLHMSRSALSLKVTDTSLIALDGDRLGLGCERRYSKGEEDGMDGMHVGVDVGVNGKVAMGGRLEGGHAMANLVMINLSGCDMIIDAGVLWIAKSCRRLEYLYLLW